MEQATAGSKTFRRRIAGMAAAAALLPCMALGEEEPIKVGVLHSSSGTKAISETTLKEVMLMLIMDRGRVVAGARGELDEAEVRRYLTV